LSNFLNTIRPILTHDQVRLGRDFDGGYVVNTCAIKNANLISLGINNDWSFENDFLNYSSNKILMYDGSINIRFFKKLFLLSILNIFSLKFILKSFNSRNYFISYFKNIIFNYKLYKNFKIFTSKTNIEFYSKFVSNTPNTIRLNNIIQDNFKKNEKIFLKIDIEGHEYRMIDEIILNQDLITGMVIEFHDIDLMLPLFNDIINKLKSYFYITHVHANNHAHYSEVIDTLVIYEISFINKNLQLTTPQYFQNGVYNKIGLDFRNIKDKNEYLIKFPPL